MVCSTAASNKMLSRPSPAWRPRPSSALDLGGGLCAVRFFGLAGRFASWEVALDGGEATSWGFCFSPLCRFSTGVFSGASGESGGDPFRSWPDLWFPSGDGGDGEGRRLVVSAQGRRQAGGGSDVAASPLWWVEADPGPEMYGGFPSADEPQRRRPRGPLQRFSTRRCAMMHLRLQGCWCSAPFVGGGFGAGSVKKQTLRQFSSEDLEDLFASPFFGGSLCCCAWTACSSVSFLDVLAYCTSLCTVFFYE